MILRVSFLQPFFGASAWFTVPGKIGLTFDSQPTW